MESGRNIGMNSGPRLREDYSERQVEAARRVLVDVGQVLASFVDCLVVVGGWIPDLLLPQVDEPHIGSIDVDLALDAAKLSKGRYAELLKLLLDTKRYKKGAKDFQLVVEVDLKDGEKSVQVEVEFLAPKEAKLKKNKPRLLADFRVLQADGCGVAFHAPVEQTLSGRNVRGAKNTVRLRLASLADFIVMKAHAIGGREKPKDSYDLCYCLEHFPDGVEPFAARIRLISTLSRSSYRLKGEGTLAMVALCSSKLTTFAKPARCSSKATVEYQLSIASVAWPLIERFTMLLTSAARVMSWKVRRIAFGESCFLMPAIFATASKGF
jgi:hypothetical protein